MGRCFRRSYRGLREDRGSFPSLYAASMDVLRNSGMVKCLVLPYKDIVNFYALALEYLNFQQCVLGQSLSGVVEMAVVSRK